jgi:hypothetical protein
MWDEKSTHSPCEFLDTDTGGCAQRMSVAGVVCAVKIVRIGKRETGETERKSSWRRDLARHPIFLSCVVWDAASRMRIPDAVVPTTLFLLTFSPLAGHWRQVALGGLVLAGGKQGRRAQPRSIAPPVTHASPEPRIDPSACLTRAAKTIRLATVARLGSSRFPFS